MAAQDKTPREQETRSTSARPTKWRPPQLLPSPNPEEGFAFRWVRIANLGDPDPTNTSSKLREGWVPVKAEDYPELMVAATPSGRYAGCVEVGGLLLCKIPSEFMEQREAYYADMAVAQVESVENDFFRENNEKMPLFKEGSSRVTKFGSGN
jgi:hypothetical protein